MKQKFTSVKVSALAIALGASYVGAIDCYFEGTATTCISSGAIVDQINFCEGGNGASSCSTVPVYFYAHSTWYKHPYTEGSGGPYTATFYHPCGGPIHFTNPLNGQSSNTETCSYWQNGIYNSQNGGPWGDMTHIYNYNGVDYTTSGCSE